MENLHYPIGRFTFDENVTPQKRSAWIEDFERLPGELRRAVRGLSAEQLDTPYRPGGWTVRQLVHHLADSHMNGFIRSKLAVTETSPRIKPYNQEDWVKTGDAAGEVEPSLGLIEGLQARWARLFSSLSGSDFERTFDHPESGTQTLDYQLQHYSWHGRHHVAHIVSLRKRKDWKY
jgi:uncharacterized damage-inducible protein DinB